MSYFMSFLSYIEQGILTWYYISMISPLLLSPHSLRGPLWAAPPAPRVGGPVAPAHEAGPAPGPAHFDRQPIDSPQEGAPQGNRQSNIVDRFPRKVKISKNRWILHVYNAIGSAKSIQIQPLIANVKERSCKKPTNRNLSEMRISHIVCHFFAMESSLSATAA